MMLKRRHGVSVPSTKQLMNKGRNINLRMVKLSHQSQNCACNRVKCQLPPDLKYLTLAFRNKENFPRCVSSSQEFVWWQQ